MRFICAGSLFCGFLFGQIAQTPQQAKVPDTAVVATIDGKKYTAGEVRAMAAGLPAQFQQSIAISPESAVQQILLTRYLAAEALKQNLDKQSPYKEQIEFQRDFLLANAEVNRYRNSMVIGSDEEEKYYHDHVDQFQAAKVRVIYISFNSPQIKTEKKGLTEAEAKSKIEELHKQLLAGADFGALAKQDSDDKESAAKGGEWGIVKRSSNQPPEVKNAIFSLKPGSISEPVKQANGFYIFKLDELSTQPLNEVASDVAEKLRQERFNTWLKGIQSRFTVTVENSDFFPHKPAPAASR